MAARQVGIYSVKGINCTTSFEGKENVRVEAIALIKGPFPFRTPVQIEKVKSSLYSQPKVNWLQNSKRHGKAIELSGRHSISLLTISSIPREGLLPYISHIGRQDKAMLYLGMCHPKRYGVWAFLV